MSAKSGNVILKLLVVLVLLGAAVAGVVYYVRPVAHVVKIGRGTAANVVPGSVQVDAERASPIASEVDGKVESSTLERGKAVKENDVLVQLDTGDLKLEIERVEAELKAAEDGAKIAKAIADANEKSKKEELDAAERDYKEKLKSELAIDQARRAYEIAQQMRKKNETEEALNIARLDNALKVAKRRMEKMTIRAPFDGTISEVVARKNDQVTAKQAVANIIADARLVRAKISEENFAAIKIGDKAEVSFLGYRGKKFTATVTQKLPTAEADTQRYTVYLKVDIPPDQLLANLTGDVGITVDERPNALLVPSRAMWDGYVRVIENGRAYERKLETGFIGLNQVEVVKGAKEGDLVVVEDPDKFEDGQRVRVEMAR